MEVVSSAAVVSSELESSVEVVSSVVAVSSELESSVEVVSSVVVVSSLVASSVELVSEEVEEATESAEPEEEPPPQALKNRTLKNNQKIVFIFKK